NTEDADVGRFLRLFTELPLDEIARLERLAGAEINEAKKILAFEATALRHGAEAAEAAAAAARAQFEEGGPATGLPSVTVDAARLAAGMAIIELFQLAGLATSNAEARRLVRGGGARLNDERVDDELLVVDGSALTDGRLKLSAGRKRHVLVEAG
ncbi:MAG: tyrosine--tRNA ligase, partial [Geminicoccaceae bacterium]|nr:tyrosine--tRNA ligase [Geminicoccaceae bacterium]